MTTIEMPASALPDMAQLHDHVRRCADARSRWHRLQCAVESIDAFLAPRFVTTLALTLVVLAGVSLAA